jgi:hypothetical protein
MTTAARAAAPPGVESMDMINKKPLIEALYSSGYSSNVSLYNPRQLELSIKAYLWDNRSELKAFDLLHEHESDIAICLFIINGNKTFKHLEKNKSFISFCSEHVEGYETGKSDMTQPATQ